MPACNVSRTRGTKTGLGNLRCYYFTCHIMSEGHLKSTMYKPTAGKLNVTNSHNSWKDFLSWCISATKYTWAGRQIRETQAPVVDTTRDTMTNNRACSLDETSREHGPTRTKSKPSIPRRLSTEGISTAYRTPPTTESHRFRRSKKVEQPSQNCQRPRTAEHLEGVSLGFPINQPVPSPFPGPL